MLSLEVGEAGSIPLWILILAILAGLLFLAILTFILHRLGFFKRKRPEDYNYQVTLQVGKMKSYATELGRKKTLDFLG